MTLEGMIRNAVGETAVKRVDAADYSMAKTQLEQLVGEGSILLYLRAVSDPTS